MLAMNDMTDTHDVVSDYRSGPWQNVNRCKYFFKKVKIYVIETRKSFQSLYMCNKSPGVNCL
jgi:hypothetical protein